MAAASSTGASGAQLDPPTRSPRHWQEILLDVARATTGSGPGICGWAGRSCSSLAPTAYKGKAENQEYSLSSTSDCVYAPGVLDGTGSGSLLFEATAPKRLVPTQETDLTAAASTVTLPKALTEFLVALGGHEVRGSVTSLFLDFEHLEPPSLNAATPEGWPVGLSYRVRLEGGKETQLVSPKPATSNLGRFG